MYVERLDPHAARSRHPGLREAASWSGHIRRTCGPWEDGTSRSPTRRSGRDRRRPVGAFRACGLLRLDLPLPRGRRRQHQRADRERDRGAAGASPCSDEFRAHAGGHPALRPPHHRRRQRLPRGRAHLRRARRPARGRSPRRRLAPDARRRFLETFVRPHGSSTAPPAPRSSRPLRTGRRPASRHGAHLRSLAPSSPQHQKPAEPGGQPAEQRSLRILFFMRSINYDRHFEARSDGAGRRVATGARRVRRRQEGAGREIVACSTRSRASPDIVTYGLVPAAAGHALGRLRPGRAPRDRLPALPGAGVRERTARCASAPSSGARVSVTRPDPAARVGRARWRRRAARPLLRTLEAARARGA